MNLRQQPDIPQELRDRASACDRLEMFLKRYPRTPLLQEVISRETSIAAGSLRTRRGELQRTRAMRIDKLKRWFTDSDGARHRLPDAWMYVPCEPLGPSAETIRSGQREMFP